MLESDLGRVDLAHILIAVRLASNRIPFFFLSVFFLIRPCLYTRFVLLFMSVFPCSVFDKNTNVDEKNRSSLFILFF